MTLLGHEVAPRASQATGEARLVDVRHAVPVTSLGEFSTLGERVVVPAHPGAAVAERHDVPGLVVTLGVHAGGGYR